MTKGKQRIPSDCEECANDNCFLKLSAPFFGKFIQFHKKPITIKARYPVFKQGEDVEGIFFIFKGKVKVTTQGQNGRTQIIRLVKEGEILGHRGYSGGAQYKVSAIALEDSSICFLENKDFLDLLALNNKLAVELVMFYAAELGIADEKLRVMAVQNNLQKIADSLIMVHQTFGFEPGGKTLGYTLSRKEIGEIAGTVPDVVSRSLAKLAEMNLIELQGKKIAIPDLDVLVEFVHKSDPA